MNRKEFLKTSAAAALCCGSLGGFAACATYRYVDPTKNRDSLQIPKTVFEEDFFVLVRNPVHSIPIYLIKNAKDSYAAYLLECTHKQCTVKPTGDTLTCPCHGSKYNNQGKVLDGPAERDLSAFEVITDDQNIYIQLQKQSAS